MSEDRSIEEIILKGIDDTSPIYSHADRSVALKNFIVAYEEQTKLDGTLPILTPTTTGRELKDAHRMLETDARLSMLVAYYNTLYKKSSGESAAAVKEREQKHWLVRFTAIFGAVTFWGIIAIVAILWIKGGSGPDKDMVKNLMTSLIDIMKVILGAK